MASDPGTIDRWRRAEEALVKLAAIRSRKPEEASYRADTDLRDIVERNFHVAIEAAMDLANELIAARGWRAPSTAREAFQVLAENGAIDAAAVQAMSGWVGFRNVLVHGDSRVEAARVLQILEHELGDLRARLVDLARAFGVV